MRSPQLRDESFGKRRQTVVGDSSSMQGGPVEEAANQVSGFRVQGSRNNKSE
jgi:hypothetical protein